ncbi:hypothetical protein MKW92_021893 [Papaver armeniacum]|nr:hypothetical protein MKW92_021893 [Papaver armeniacum]
MERGGSSSIQIQRMSSIERGGSSSTIIFCFNLFFYEAALFVLNNRSSEEAINIFTEVRSGLESVNSGDMQKGGHVMLDSDDKK